MTAFCLQTNKKLSPTINTILRSYEVVSVESDTKKNYLWAFFPNIQICMPYRKRFPDNVAALSSWLSSLICPSLSVLPTPRLSRALSFHKLLHNLC